MYSDFKTWHFGIKNDELIELVLSGKKTATSSLYDGTIDEINTKSVLIYDNEKTACITKIVKNIVCKFNEVEEYIAKLEGENESLEEWRKEHYKYFKSINKDFTDDTMVLIEIFEVTKNLKQERLEIGTIIANTNKDILGNIETINEINSGFNNTIFNVNNKYIIKVCENKSLENLFDVENNFYNENNNNLNIPKLYKFDRSKNIVPYVYEIIEKIDGKSIYYYWHKWNEVEREHFIHKLIEALNIVHKYKKTNDTWKDNLKNEIIINYNKCINLFNEEEKDIISKAFDFYDDILFDNHYALIHNDLHFDNILLDKNNEIKIIDFNDSIIAPFDYDLRILFMCQDKPWKWANIEMDPYQKPEDYKNIRKYIKKYYKKLSNIKYIDERMIIYEILNDIRNLPKYKLREQIDNIVLNSKKIIMLFVEFSNE